MAKEAQMMMYGSCKIPHNMKLKTLWIGEKATVEATNGGGVTMLVDGSEVPVAPGYYEGEIQLIVS